MLRNRIIPCLLLQDGGLVKTIKFKEGKYIGDPLNAIKIFNEKEVDELVFLDIDATKCNQEPKYDLIKEIATECFMPFSYGGGINNLNQIEKILKIGVEKVIINNTIFVNPNLLKEASKEFGNSTIIGAVDVKCNFWGKKLVYNYFSKKTTNLYPLEYCKTLEDYGVGEILLNSVDREGTGMGYDLDLIKDLSSNLKIPLIVNGGAHTMNDFKEALVNGASAAVAGSFFVFQGSHKAVLITYPSYKEINELI